MRGKRGKKEEEEEKEEQLTKVGIRLKNIIIEYRKNYSTEQILPVGIRFSFPSNR